MGRQRLALASTPIGAAADSAIWVSCTSSTFCLVVDNLGNSYRFNGTVWTSSDSNGLLNTTTVSCVSATFCVAATDSGYQLVWNAIAWSTEFEVDPAAIDLQSVACTTPTFCVGVDAGGAVVGT